MPPITPDDEESGVTIAGEGASVSGDASEQRVTAGPIGGESSAPAGKDLFADAKARVGAYKVGGAALKKTVSQYADRRNHCSGEITVRTEDTPLNVRSGPSTGSPVITKVQKGSKQNVLLWAPDSKQTSGRWFLLVDEKSKTVKGWVAGDYCEAGKVVFAN
jgi:uncharacterized protein YgiM (DUF1202 family)